MAGVFPCIIHKEFILFGGTTVAHMRDETLGDDQRLDQLLEGFKSRNEFRSDPNYVLVPVDVATPITDRFVKILRDSSLGSVDEEIESVEETPAEPEANAGLVLLAEQYDKNSQQKLSRARTFNAIALVILLTAVITFAAMAQLILAGIVVAVIAIVFLVMSRSSAKQAEEIQQIASALTTSQEVTE